MEKGNSYDKTGFTIIEVVLVLAIAGLIFLMVFIAFPALSRTQRDAKRRDDISILLKKVKDYQTNNRGALPNGVSNNIDYDTVVGTNKFSWAAFYHDYLGDGFKDPNGSYYKIDVVQCSGASSPGVACTNELSSENPTFPHNMKIVIQATCDGGEKAVATNNPRKIAVQYKLEGGGIYCANT